MSEDKKTLYITLADLGEEEVKRVINEEIAPSVIEENNTEDLEENIFKDLVSDACKDLFPDYFEVINKLTSNLEEHGYEDWDYSDELFDFIRKNIKPLSDFENELEKTSEKDFDYYDYGEIPPALDHSELKLLEFIINRFNECNVDFTGIAGDFGCSDDKELKRKADYIYTKIRDLC